MRIWVDGEGRRIIANPFNSGGGTVPPMHTGENLLLDVCPVKPTGRTSPPFWEPDTSYSNNSWKIAAGILDREVDEGQLSVQVVGGATQTGLLDYNIEGAAFATALNALGEVSAAGSVEFISGDYTQGFRFRWLTVGASKPTFEAAATGLVPEAQFVQDIELAGTASVREVFILRYWVKPAAFTEFAAASAPMPAGGIAVTPVQTGGAGVNAVVSVSFSDTVLGGAMSLVIAGNPSPSINWNDTQQIIEQKIESTTGVGDGNVSVTGSITSGFTLSFQGTLAETDMGAITALDSLVWPVGVRCNLDLRTPAAFSLLFGLASENSATFEIETTSGTPGESRVKLVHQGMTLINGLIDAEGLLPADRSTFYTESEVNALLAEVYNSVIRHRKDITLLTGGGSNALDSITTVGIVPDLPYAVSFKETTTGYFRVYLLRAGTAAESSPDVIRPDDYDGSTNAVYWELQSMFDDSHLLRADAATDGTGTQSFVGLSLAQFANSAIAAGAVTATRSLISLTSETGTDDELDSLVATKGGGDIVVLKATATHTITVNHLTGNIHLQNETPKVLAGEARLLLIYDGTNFVEVIGTSTTSGGSASITSATSLTGGTANDLDSIVTATLDVGTLAHVIVPMNSGVSGVELVYRLTEGTAAEAAPWIVRGDDYAVTTNEKYWELIAPWGIISYEYLGKEDDHAGSVMPGLYAPHHLYIHEAQLDLAALPSGSGAGPISWNVLLGASQLFGAHVSQGVLTLRANAGGYAFSVNTCATGTLINWWLVGAGGGMLPGKGAILHLTVRYSPINS